MRALLTLLACLPCAALAGPPTMPTTAPDGAEIQKVLSYYYGENSDTPLLVESKLCSEVATEGQLKNECLHEIAPDAVQPDTDAYLWLNFMVPYNAPDQKILIQFDHEGITRQATEATLRSGIRYRTWKKFRLDRKGAWRIKILHDAANGAYEVKHIDVQIAGAPVADAGE